MHRFLYLQNGSLLIVHAQYSDGQRFRCLAQNPLSSLKPERNYTTLLRVIAVSDNDDPLPPNYLLPRLQNSSITIREGRSLDLFCAGRTQSDVSWSASYMTTTMPQVISVENAFRLDNVSLSQTGDYNCSTANNFQVILSRFSDVENIYKLIL